MALLEKYISALSFNLTQAVSPWAPLFLFSVS